MMTVTSEKVCLEQMAFAKDNLINATSQNAFVSIDDIKRALDEDKFQHVVLVWLDVDEPFGMGRMFLKGFDRVHDGHNTIVTVPCKNYPDAQRIRAALFGCWN